MTALLAAVLVASLLGSLHCAGMCGAFVVLAVSDTGSGARAVKPWRLQAAYHLGRLTTYMTLGAIAGFVGASLDLGASMVGVQRGAMIVSASMLLVFGVVTLLRVLGVRLPALPIPARLTRLVQVGHRAAWALRPMPRAAVIGLLTTLLPCGWLYAFVITAAGTGSPLAGPLVMLVFWLGTLPVLAAVGVGARSLAGPLGRYAPAATAIALITVATFTLVGRGNLIGMPMPRNASLAASHQPVVPDPNDVPPCCRGE